MDTVNESRVENLIGRARLAQQARDYSTAIELVREALRFAPLRSDLTRLLEELLEQAGNHSTGRDANARPLAEEPDISVRETRPVAPDSESPRGAQSACHVPTPTPVEETMKGLTRSGHPHEIRGDQLSPGRLDLVDEEFQRSSKEASTPAPSLSTDLFANDTAERRGGKTRKRRQLPTDEISVLEKRLRKHEDQDSLNLFSQVANGAEKFFQQEWSKILSPRIQASFVIYLSIFVILIVSSTVTHRKFFASKIQGVAVATPFSSAQPVTSDSSSAPPVKTAQEDFASYQALKLAGDYIAQKRYEDATTLLESQLTRTTNPDLRRSLNAELARAYNLLGTSLLERNKLLQSLTAYEKAVKLAPEKTLYLLHLANAHYYCGTMLGDSESQRYLDLAERELNEVLKTEPRNLDAYQLQAALYEHRRNHSGATAALTRIIELASPTSPEAKSAREKLKSISQAR